MEQMKTGSSVPRGLVRSQSFSASPLASVFQWLGPVTAILTVLWQKTRHLEIPPAVLPCAKQKNSDVTTQNVFHNCLSVMSMMIAKIDLMNQTLAGGTDTSTAVLLAIRSVLRITDVFH